ncbi:unnamed protein product, partial [marine sediment metagenome]
MGLPEGWLSTGIGNWLSKGIVGTVQAAVGAYDLPVPKDVSALAENEGIPTEWGVKGLSWIGATLGSPMGLLPFLTIVYQAGLAENMSNDARRVYRPSRIPPDVYARLVHRGYITKETEQDWQQDIHEQGWSDERVEALMASYRVILSIGELRELYLRGMLGEGEAAKTEAIARIMQHGITENDANRLLALFETIPPLSDMVRFADFAGFDPEVIEKWREYYDAPDEVRKAFALVGIFGDW